MYQRILVPLDGSTRAERSVPVAARLARATGGVVVLVEVVRAVAEFEVTAVPVTTWAPAAVPEERDAAASYLSRIAASDALSGIATQTGVYAGPAAEVLLLVARSQNVDTIVITSRGRTGLARWALGSVADKVARHSAVPVLLLRDHGPLHLGIQADTSRPPRVLVPLDGSELAEAALVPAGRMIAAFAGEHPAAMHLVRVVDVMDMAYAPRAAFGEQATVNSAREWALDTAKKYLTDVASRLREGDLAHFNLSLTWSAVVDAQVGSYEGDVAATILRAAEVGEAVEGTTAAGRCDLIAMATHGRGGLARWAMGSIAERVLGAATLPVLIIRPKTIAPGADMPTEGATHNKPAGSEPE